jgi:hypothetical protein
MVSSNDNWICDHHERFSVYANNHETIGMGSILFWFALFLHVDLHPALQHIYGTQHTSEYNTGANQVGEMFANYNLIAAPFFITTIAKYTSRKFTHLLH